MIIKPRLLVYPPRPWGGACIQRERQEHAVVMVVTTTDDAEGKLAEYMQKQYSSQVLCLYKYLVSRMFLYLQCVYVSMCICICICTCICICVYAYAYVYDVYVHVYVCICIYIVTHVYEHIHDNINKSSTVPRDNMLMRGLTSPSKSP